MGANSGIAWTHHTFNPWWGCTKVSPGCKNCYAEKFATVRRKLPIWGADAPRKIASEAMWRQPLLWNRRAGEKGVRERVFCASMADVFEDYRGPDMAQVVQARARLWETIEATPHLDWLLLTKRPENMRRMLSAKGGEVKCEVFGPMIDGRRETLIGKEQSYDWQIVHAGLPVEPRQAELTLPSNLWLGTTVENQDEANRRIPALLDINCAVRFVSYEPALGPIDFTRIKLDEFCADCESHEMLNALTHGSVGCECGTEATTLTQLSWVIVGGESGSGARPFNPAWALRTVEQCKDHGVPVFVKQMGANPTMRSGSSWGPIKDRKGGEPNEWPKSLRVREVPGNA